MAEQEQQEQQEPSNIEKIQEAIGIDYSEETLGQLFLENGQELTTDNDRWFNLGSAIRNLVAEQEANFLHEQKTKHDADGRTWNDLTLAQRKAIADFFHNSATFMWGYTLGRAKERYQRELQNIQQLLKEKK